MIEVAAEILGQRRTRTDRLTRRRSKYNMVRRYAKAMLNMINSGQALNFTQSDYDIATQYPFQSDSWFAQQEQLTGQDFLELMRDVYAEFKAKNSSYLQGEIEIPVLGAKKRKKPKVGGYATYKVGKVVKIRTAGGMQRQGLMPKLTKGVKKIIEYSPPYQLYKFGEEELAPRLTKGVRKIVNVPQQIFEQAQEQGEELKKGAKYLINTGKELVERQQDLVRDVAENITELPGNISSSIGDFFDKHKWWILGGVAAILIILLLTSKGGQTIIRTVSRKI